MDNELKLCLVSHAEACEAEGRPYGPAGREAELKKLVELGFLEYHGRVRTMLGDFWYPTEAGWDEIRKIRGN
jgi:hypothetical protein